MAFADDSTIPWARSTSHHGSFHGSRRRESQHALDQSITAFASVRNLAVSSDPSFGDWMELDEQKAKKRTYTDDVVPVMIEVTRGSPNKYEVEKATGQLQLDRVLHSSIYYPGDYGYVPQTLCGDGDPLDIIIVSPADATSDTQGLDSGVMVNCRVVGLMDMEDESGHDEKIIAVLADQAFTDHIKDKDDVPEHLRREIHHFFENYKVLEMKKGKPKWARVIGWGDKAKAMEVVVNSRKMYKKGKDTIHPFVKVQKCPNLLHVQQSFDSVEEMDSVIAYVNVSKGCMNSYVYRQDTSFRHYKYTLDMPYPGDYGWICRTWQSDTRKPVEVLIISTFPMAAECLCDVRIVGALERTFKTEAGKELKDFKVIAVVTSDPRMAHINTLSNFNTGVLAHFERFFLHTAEQGKLTGAKISNKFESAKARQMVMQARTEYEEFFEDKVVHNAPDLRCLAWMKESTVGEPHERIYPAVVEASKHTSNKYVYDETYGVLAHSAPMKTSTFWPGNYGFIPQTVAEDGRPVDVMLLSTVPLRNNSVAEIRVVGAAKCIDEMGPDLKMVAVPKSEPRMKEWKDITDVPKHMLDEMVHFFNAYKDLESDWKFSRFERWLDGKDACSYLATAHSRFFLFVLPMQRLEKRVAELEEENMALKKAR
eukprot:TRINITY_DN1092_c0_g1_i1.p2 TRINITY_DN1092_c0_g1~~TRINITY_DN1092_c0_g1_i1.p2  ORF type:complete len:651 (+),score=214.35 TRINITY_DN1092_c0_g1_i1:86-2038(+)